MNHEFFEMDYECDCSKLKRNPKPFSTPSGTELTATKKIYTQPK